MTAPRLFQSTPLVADAEIALDAEAAHHALGVLRVQAGDRVVLFDGSGLDYPAVITVAARAGVRARTAAPAAAATESPLAVELLQGVCRGPRMDTVLQKATELGATRIEPVLAERSVVRLEGEQGLRKRAHWQRIVVSACEQCGRSRVPAVGAPRRLAEALPALGAGGLRLLLDPGADRGVADLPARGADPGRVVLLVGPEGGLTADERVAAARAGFLPVRLGPRVLRTETAPLAALALLQHRYGDL